MSSVETIFQLIKCLNNPYKKRKDFWFRVVYKNLLSVSILRESSAKKVIFLASIVDLSIEIN